MDGPRVKSEFVGFKCTPELKLKLSGVAKVNGVSISKFVCYVLMQFFDMPVPLRFQSWILPESEVSGNE